MENDQYLLFIDSGIGGISILDTFLSKKRDANIIYYADNINFPYGNKPENIIGDFLYKIYSKISQKYNVTLIVIACNTASVSSLAYLRNKVNIPVIGTVPAIKPASLSSKRKKIGIIATKTTIKSGYLLDLINDFAPNMDIFIKPATKLVKAVEKNYSPNKVKKVINAELKYFKDKDIDTLVLGCTHYSFLFNEINDYFSGNVKILDSREGVSKRIIDVIGDNSVFTKHEKLLFLSKSKNGIIKTYQKLNDRYKIFDSISEDEFV